jgi:hypothetical protein
MGSAFVSQQYLQNVLGSRAGMASGTADLLRDLGGAIMQSIFGALLTAGYAAVGPVVPDHLAAVILDHRFTGCDATPPGVLEM